MRISTLHYTTTVDDPPRRQYRSYTLPPSPTYSRSPSNSSSSDFEFSIISSSTTTASAAAATERSSVSAADITPADDLFYKGKILPLQLTPRLSMVKSLFFDSSNNSSASSASANSRHSTCSSSSSDAVMSREDASESLRRPSRRYFADLAENDDVFIISELTSAGQSGQRGQSGQSKSKSFSLGKKLSSVFKKEPTRKASPSDSTTSTARDVMRKYLTKVKPFYEKMARKRKVLNRKSEAKIESKESGMFYDLGVAKSCPASIRSSPCHSGHVLSRVVPPMCNRDSSSEELHNAIQGAIAHCKNSMLQSKS